MQLTGMINDLIAWRNRGLPAVPLRRGRPLVAWSQWQNRLPVPDELLALPWESADGMAFILAHPEPDSGRYWWVLDVERAHRPLAEAWLDAHVPGWRNGLVAESQRGGLHLYALASHPVPTGRHPWGDIKGVGSLIYAPPTKRFKPDALDDYRWASCRPEHAVWLEPGDLPWPGLAENGHRSPVAEAVRRTIPVGERNVTLTRVAGLLRGQLGLEPDEVLSVLELVNQRCEEPLPLAELRSIARSSARWEPNPRVQGNGQHPSADDRALEAVEVATLPEPPPRRWLLADLLPEGTVTLLFGDDGVGKSLVATAVAVALAGGFPVLGRPTRPGPVLYVDTEFDADEFVRRAYRLARGAGHSAPPRGLYYYRARYSLTTPGGQAELTALVERYRPVLVVVDSLTLGSFTDDLKEAMPAAQVLEFLSGLPTTVLALDHIPKPAPGASQAYARPWGSFAKRAKARHALLLTPSDAGGLVLRVTKSNLGAPGTVVGIDLRFDGDAVQLVAVELDDEALAGAEAHLPPLEQVGQALRRRGTATPEELAEETGLAVGTVKNKLTALRRQGRAEPLGDGRWRAVSALPSLVTVTKASDSDSDADNPDKPHRDAEIDHWPPEGNPDTLGLNPDRAPETEPVVCCGCGRPLDWDRRHRRPRWCSEACRKRAERERPSPAAGMAAADPTAGGALHELAERLERRGWAIGWPLLARSLAEAERLPFAVAQPALQALVDQGRLVADRHPVTPETVLTPTDAGRPGPVRGGAEREGSVSGAPAAGRRDGDRSTAPWSGDSSQSPQRTPVTTPRNEATVPSDLDDEAVLERVEALLAARAVPTGPLRLPDGGRYERTERALRLLVDIARRSVPEARERALRELRLALTALGTRGMT
ncbi:MAG: AAA family ATPase [Thermomicrobium sp.]|nr:AAA family ATPase [Thermomicrobium sp.]